MAFISTLELAQFAEKELGHDTSSGSTQRADITSWLDYGHKIVLAGGDLLNIDENGRKKEENIIFSFARSATPKTLILRPALTDRTVTAVRQSTSITFDDVPDGVNSIVGWHIRINNEPELYYVTAHTANTTTATIAGGYVGTANVTAATSSLMKLRYDIGSSDILRLASPLQGFKSDSNEYRHINIVDKEELYESYPPDRIQEGYPACACIIQENAGTFTLQFSSTPTDLEIIELDYVAIPTTLDTTTYNPIFPARFRVLLAYLACHYIGLRNNDNRVDKWLKIAQNIFKDMVLWDQNNSSSIDDNFSKVRIKGFGRNLPNSLTVKSYT